MVLVMLSIKKIPVADAKTAFTDEQLESLKEKVGAKTRDQIVKALDKHATEIAAEQDDSAELKAMKEELAAFLDENGLTEEEAQALVTDPDADPSATDKTAMEMLQNLTEKYKQQDAKIEQLMKEPEPDKPIDKGAFAKPKGIMHSKTHFLGTNRNLDAFEGRNWNQRAAGISTTPTDWSVDGNAWQKLKSDLYDNHTEIDDRIKSLFRDDLKLPGYFRMRSNISDRVADGNIATAEITQARKLPWLAKNKYIIQPEEGRVFPVNIDIELLGYDLQKLEESWLARWNREGTSPYKMGFVDFLLMEWDKQARTEDRIVAINGVYSPTPDDATVPGQAINRGDGLMIQLFRALHIDKKIKVPNIGSPSTMNIVDYVTQVIENNLDETIRNKSGLVFNLHPDWLRAYKTRYKQIHGTETGWVNGEEMTIENYPNIRFEKIYDLQNKDFMFITFDNNVELLENLPNEKSVYRMDTLKRIIYIYADYKWGARFVHIGTKVDDDAPEAFKVQTVWTNGLPMFNKDFYVAVGRQTSTEVAIPYSNIAITDDFNTDIAKITGTYPGQVVKIKGNQNSLAGKAVKNNTDLDLSADFPLNNGGTLTLYVNTDGTLKELSRTTTPDITGDSSAVEFSDDTISATEGTEFDFVGTSAVTLATIENGFEGQEIDITFAGSGAGALTIDSVAGNISVASQAVLDAAGDTIKLVYIDGVFTEVSRTIA